MPQHTNDAVIGVRFLTARGAAAADVTGNVARIDRTGIDTHRMRYGHRHARGADWTAENAREHARISAGRLLVTRDARTGAVRHVDAEMLADGAHRARVSVPTFVAALIASDAHQSVPTGMDAPVDAQPRTVAPITTSADISTATGRWFATVTADAPDDSDAQPTRKTRGRRR